MAVFHFRAPTHARLPHLHTMLNSIGNDAAVPLPFVRVVPLRIILFLIRCYWSIFGIR